MEAQDLFHVKRPHLLHVRSPVTHVEVELKVFGECLKNLSDPKKRIAGVLTMNAAFRVFAGDYCLLLLRPRLLGKVGGGQQQAEG